MKMKDIYQVESIKPNQTSMQAKIEDLVTGGCGYDKISNNMCANLLYRRT